MDTLKVDVKKYSLKNNFINDFNKYCLDLRQKCDSSIPLNNFKKFKNLFESLKLTAVRIGHT